MLPIVSVVLFALFQGAVTWWIWRGDTFQRSEKIAQTKLVWLLPVLGAAVVLPMLIEESRHRNG